MVEYETHFNGAIKSEYVIWGYHPNSNEHTLLVFAPDGKVITDREVAERIVWRLENDYKCTGVTIQKIAY